MNRQELKALYHATTDEAEKAKVLARYNKLIADGVQDEDIEVVVPTEKKAAKEVKKEVETVEVEVTEKKKEEKPKVTRKEQLKRLQKLNNYK